MLQNTNINNWTWAVNSVFIWTSNWNVSWILDLLHSQLQGADCWFLKISQTITRQIQIYLFMFSTSHVHKNANITFLTRLLELFHLFEEKNQRSRCFLSICGHGLTCSWIIRHNFSSHLVMSWWYVCAITTISCLGWHTNVSTVFFSLSLLFYNHIFTILFPTINHNRLLPHCWRYTQ